MRFPSGNQLVRAFASGAVVLAVPVGLIAKQPDLGTALLVGAAGFYVLFLAGLSWKIIIGLAIAGAIFGVTVYALSGARPQTPDLDEFLDGDSPAWHSPPLLARLRRALPPQPTPAAKVHTTAPTTSNGPILFAYDGTDRAARAITQAATQLADGRDAVVLCVWRPVDVGFTPVGTTHFDADKAGEVRGAAERTAEHGATIANEAGYNACSLAVEAAPTWQGIVDTAEGYGASVIVLGPHRRSKLLGQLQGSVVEAVLGHTDIPVLAIPERINNRANVFQNEREFALS